MPKLRAPNTHDAATALGTFIIAAIEHLTDRDSGCCPSCCAQCNALWFYYSTEDCPAVADVAVRLALKPPRTTAEDEPDPDWMFEQEINWKYLVQFWPAQGEHLPSCHV